MSASKFTIYLLKSMDKSFSGICKDIVDEYNNNESEKSDSNNINYVEQDIRADTDTNFKNIDEVKVYIAPHKTKPKWKETLKDIVASDDLESIENTNYSFIFFIKIKDSIFSITGGKGHLAISTYKDYFFGLDILSKIMNPNENIIKGTGDRTLHGNRFSGIQQFNNFVTLRSEDNISSYFRQINTHMSKKTISKEFGIELSKGREGVNFLARDSIKLGKSLTLQELDIFIKNIKRLVDKKDSKSVINKFTEINNRDTLFTELNRHFENEIKDFANGKDIESSMNLLNSSQMDLECDSYLLKNSSKKVLFSSDAQITLRELISVLKTQYPKKKDLKKVNLIEKFFKPIRLIGYLEDEIEVDDRIYDLLDVQMKYNDSTYLFIGGKWFLLDNQFISEINSLFKDQVTPLQISSEKINFLNAWKSGSEGDYNYSHNDIDGVLVLDKMLVEQIEVCDLMAFRDDRIYYIHVKDGLAGDTRILCNQVLIAMQAIQNAKTHSDHNFLEQYYESISNKASPEKSEQLRCSAEKFIKAFPKKDAFVQYIKKSTPTFIFAYRPKKGMHDIKEPQTIASTPAKIAMLNMIREAKLYDVDLRIATIKN